MHEYKAQTFNLPKLEGISEESVKQHISLYEGYVKNFNSMTSQLVELLKDSDPAAAAGAGKNVHPIAELVRRRAFEFDGMRLHEYYFEQLVGGGKPISSGGRLTKALESEYDRVGGFEKFIKQVAATRGPGWAILYYDAKAKELNTGFVGEQHQGHFVTLPIILALDVWEHAYILDYGTLGRGKYVEAFFKNLNWGVIEKRFDELS